MIGVCYLEILSIAVKRLMKVSYLQFGLQRPNRKKWDFMVSIQPRSGWYANCDSLFFQYLFYFF